MPDTLPVSKQPRLLRSLSLRLGGFATELPLLLSSISIQLRFDYKRRQVHLLRSLSTRNNRNDMLALACKGCGAEGSSGSKRCRVCGISRPGSLLRASIIRPTALALPLARVIGYPISALVNAAAR